MAYGNVSDRSGTGVLFTRNPTNGDNKLFGEYLVNAQGEDVVAGIRTPMPISTLKDTFPQVYSELYETVKNLERHMKDMQVGVACYFAIILLIIMLATDAIATYFAGLVVSYCWLYECLSFCITAEYYSKRLWASERNYSATDREDVAIR